MTYADTTTVTNIVKGIDQPQPFKKVASKQEGLT